jgi:hypothetical protein
MCSGSAWYARQFLAPGSDKKWLPGIVLMVAIGELPRDDDRRCRGNTLKERQLRRLCWRR